jgi:hypothetical protein
LDDLGAEKLNDGAATDGVSHIGRTDLDSGKLKTYDGADEELKGSLKFTPVGVIMGSGFLVQWITILFILSDDSTNKSTNFDWIDCL